MVKYFDSISEDHQEWIQAQPVFFVGSAPSIGQHINLSPKGLPSSSFSILGPNEVAYIDSTGSGNETISHVRENSRVTMMFCSFETGPRIMRLFCRGEIIEWNEKAYPETLKRMGRPEGWIPGARAVVLLHVFKVQTSCGFGVPLLALTTDPTTEKPKPYLADRGTLGHFAAVTSSKNKIHSYQRDNNYVSLDGLPGLKSAMVDRGMWFVNARIWAFRHRREIELASSMMVAAGATVAVMWAKGWTNMEIS